MLLEYETFGFIKYGASCNKRAFAGVFRTLSNINDGAFFV